MKRNLFLSVALLCSSPLLSAKVGDTLNLTAGFVADGVAGTYTEGAFHLTAAESSRLYDSTKGWAVNGDSGGDSLMCWAHTTSNMIQYWQSYYGVFYKGDEDLPYGSNYTRTYRSNFAHIPDVTVPDPMRLNVMKRFIDTNWLNSAGKVTNGTDWFFTWTSASAGGGYYNEYFGSYDSSTNNQPKTATVTEVSTLENLTAALLPAMGITKQADGSYKQTEAGLIAHLNVGADVAGKFSAHTLTCYGLTLDENGMIKSLVYADSDNNRFNGSLTDDSRSPSLEQAYVKVENGKILLYTDATLKTPLQYGSENHYYLGAVTGINTPQILTKMLAEYSDTANEALIWNGGVNGVWQTVKTDTNTLPGQETGWDVLVNGEEIEAQHQGYYHSYADDNRAVLLNQHGMNGKTNQTQDITIVGKVTPGNITVENGGNYRFINGNLAVLAGTGNVTVRNQGVLTSELSLATREITAEKGGRFSYALSTDTELNSKIAATSGGTIQFRNSSKNSDITYNYTINNRKQADETARSLKGSLIIGDKLDSYGTHLDLLYAYQNTLSLEELTLYSGSSLNAYNNTIVTGTFSALSNDHTADTDPMMKWHLDLSQAHSLIMETEVDMGNNNLILGNTPKHLTLSNSMFPILTYSESSANLSAVLFCNIKTLILDNEQFSSGDWTATDYFAHSYITDETRLILADGFLRLQGLTIPEPTSYALTLLALGCFGMYRRR